MSQAVAFLVGIYGLVCLITGYIMLNVLGDVWLKDGAAKEPRWHVSAL